MEPAPAAHYFIVHQGGIAGRKLRLATLWPCALLYALATYGNFMLLGLSGPSHGVPQLLVPGAAILGMLVLLERGLALLPNLVTMTPAISAAAAGRVYGTAGGGGAVHAGNGGRDCTPGGG